jgi:hypothetical protein
MRTVRLYPSGDHKDSSLPFWDTRWRLLGNMVETPKRERSIPGSKELTCLWPDMSRKKVEWYLDTVADR